MQVKNVMSRETVSVSPRTSISEAAARMRDEKVGTVAVIEGDQLVGLLNDRQITCGVVASGKNPSRHKVNEFMTKRLVTGTPDMDLAQAAKIMGKQHFRRLPIVDREHHIRGILSLTDIGKQVRECMDSILDEPRKREVGRPSRFEESSIPQWLFA